MSLFEDARAKKMRAMEKAVDSIRGRYGIDSVQRASFLKRKQSDAPRGQPPETFKQVIRTTYRKGTVTS